MISSNSKNVNIDISPPEFVSAGSHKIPVSTINNLTSADLELEVVISGTYEISLTAPNGLVSTKITAGSENNMELLVTNNGSVVLSDVTLTSTHPSGWEVSFDPQDLARIEPGRHASIMAKIKADKKAIAGDYVGFWLNLSKFFSIRFQQPATSALMKTTSYKDKF